MSINPLFFFSSGWTDLQLAFAVQIKIRSFNQHLRQAVSATIPSPRKYFTLAAMQF